MGVIDTEGKKYLSDNEIFADAFNYLVYGGKQVIKAGELREIDTEFTKFSTNLGFAMKVIKHQSSDADEVIERTNHRKIDRDTALFLNTAVKLNLEYEEKSGGVDMCKALDNRMQKEKIISVMDYMRDEGKTEEDIVDKIIERFHVTRDYVLELLAPQKA